MPNEADHNVQNRAVLIEERWASRSWMLSIRLGPREDERRIYSLEPGKDQLGIKVILLFAQIYCASTLDPSLVLNSKMNGGRYSRSLFVAGATTGFCEGQCQPYLAV